MRNEKKKLQQADVFRPEEWLDGIDNIDFRKKWIDKKSDPKDPKIKKNILKVLLATVSILGVINRKDTREQLNEVLKGYAGRAKDIQRKINEASKERERIGQEAIRTLSQLGEKDLKRIIENELIYSAGQVNINAHKGQRYQWLKTKSAKPDPYHATLVGQTFNWNEGDKEGNRPTERYGCKCGIKWIK